jgi:hypothetical protein
MTSSPDDRERHKHAASSAPRLLHFFIFGNRRENRKGTVAKRLTIRAATGGLDGLKEEVRIMAVFLLKKDCTMKVRVVIHQAEEGGFWVEVPALPGCVTEPDL